MVLLIALVVGIILTVIRAKLTGRQLQKIDLKFSWLVFLAVIPQIFLFQVPALGRYVPNALVSVILVMSQALLIVFVAVNIAQPKIWVMGIGLLSNFLAIVFNGGWMPISPDTVHRIIPALPDDYPLVDRRLGLSKDWIFSPSDIQLPWLSDRFTLPGWIPYKVAFSIGDIFIAIGAILLLWSLSNPDSRRQNGTAT